MHRSPSASIRALALRIAPFVLALAAAGCASREAPRHVRAELATDLPRDVLFYPHVLYGGDSAYLVDGRWYRPGANGWVVFTDEPLELEMLRRSLEPDRVSFWSR